jgi:hypothetical protein
MVALTENKLKRLNKRKKKVTEKKANNYVVA